MSWHKVIIMSPPNQSDLQHNSKWNHLVKHTPHIRCSVGPVFRDEHTTFLSKCLNDFILMFGLMWHGGSQLLLFMRSNFTGELLYELKVWVVSDVVQCGEFGEEWSPRGSVRCWSDRMYIWRHHKRCANQDMAGTRPWDLFVEPSTTNI